MHLSAKRTWLGAAAATLAAGVPAVALAVAPAGGSPRAGAAKLPHSVCYAARTGRGLRHVSSRQARGVANHTIELVVRHCPGKLGGRGAPGATGPVGPPGPTGAPGAPGTNKPGSQTIVPETRLGFGACNPSQTAPSCNPDGGATTPLAQIGPIHIEGLCRHTYLGPSNEPGTGGGATAATYPATFLPKFGGESEAQVIVWTETGSLTFKGQVGHRENVPPGQPDYTGTTETVVTPSPTPGQIPYDNPSGTNGHGHHYTGTDGHGHVVDQAQKDPVTGEGQHIFAAASNENPDETRATDPQADVGHESDPGVVHLPQYPSFQNADGIIATSGGTVVLANVVAGINVLGQYDPTNGGCVFAGVFDQLS